MVEKIGLAATMEMGSFNQGMVAYTKGVDSMTANTQKKAGILQTALGVFTGQMLVQGLNMAVDGIKKLGASMAGMVKEAAQEETGIVKMQQALKNTTKDWEGATAAIEDYLRVQLVRVGLDDGEGRAAIQKLTEITGDYKESLAAMPVIQDMAAAKGMDLASAAMLVGRAMKGGGEMLRRYGIYLDKDATSTEILAALQQKFGGQAETLAKTTEGSGKRIEAIIGEIRETIGGVLLGPMAKFRTVFADLLAQLLPVVEALAAKLAPAFEKVGDFAAGLVAKIPSLIERIGPIFKDIAFWAQAFIDVVRGTGGDIPWDDMFPPRLAAIVETIVGLRDAIGPLFAVLSTAFSGGGLASSMSAFSDAFKALTSAGIPPDFASAIIGIATAIGQFASGIVEAVKLIGKGDFLGAFGKVFETFRNLAGDILKALGSIDWGKIWQTVKDLAVKAAATVWAKLGEIAPKVFAWIKSGIETVKNLIGGINWAAIWQAIKDLAVKVATTVWAKIGEIAPKVLAWLKTGIEAVKSSISSIDWAGIWNAIKTAAINIANSVWSKATEIAPIILKWLKSGIDALKSQISDIDWAALWQRIKEVFTGAASAQKVEDIGKAISDWIVRATKWLEGNLAPQLEAFAKMLTTMANKMTTEMGKESSPVTQALGKAFEAILKAAFALLTSPVLWQAFWDVIVASIALNEVIKQRIADKVKEIGMSIVEGIVSGVEASADKVITAIETWIKDNVIDILKSVLGIASPSTVMIRFGEEIGAGLAIGIEASSDDALKAVLSMADSIVALVQGMIDAVAGMAKAPETGNLAAWGTAIVDVLNTVMTALTGLYDYAGGPRANAIDLSRRLSKMFADVVSLVSSAAEAIGAIGALDMATVGFDKIRQFMAYMSDMLQAIVDVANDPQWGGTEAAIKAYFANARKLTDQILDVFRIVSESVSALTAMSTFNMGDPGTFEATMRANFANWEIGMNVGLYYIKHAADLWQSVGLTFAAEFADAASRALTIVSMSVESLTKIASFNMGDPDQFEALMRDNFRTWEIGLNVAILAINRAATLWATVALDAVATFAESAEKALGLVSAGVDAIVAMTDFAPTRDLPRLMRLWEQGLDIVLTQIKVIADKWADKGIDAAATFAEAAGRVVSIVGGVVSALTALADVEFPSFNSFGIMAFGLQKILEYVKAVFIQWQDDLEELSSMATFSEGAQKVVGVIQPILDALKALATLEFPPLSSFGAMAFGLQKALEYIGAVFVQWETKLEQLAGMATFSESAQKALGVIKGAIDALTALATYKSGENLAETMASFVADLDEVLIQLGYLVMRWVGMSESGALSSEILGKMALFSTNVGTVIGFIKPTVDALDALAKYSGHKHLVTDIERFKADMETMLTNLADLVLTLGSEEGVGQAQAFSTAATAISDALKIAMESLGILGESGVKDGAAGFAEAIKSALGEAKESAKAFKAVWVDAWSAVTSSINGATQALREFIAKAAEVKVPPLIEPGSPPPLAYAFMDIAKAAHRARQELEGMGGGMRSYALPSTVMAAQAAAAVSNTATVNMGGVNINNGMDQALFEARVRRIVKEAIRA